MLTWSGVRGLGQFAVKSYAYAAAAAGSTSTDTSYKTFTSEGSTWGPEPEPDLAIKTTVNSDLYKILTSEPEPKATIEPEVAPMPVGPTAPPEEPAQTTVTAPPPEEPMLYAGGTPGFYDEPPEATIPVGPTAPPEPSSPPPATWVTVPPGEQYVDPFAPEAPRPPTAKPMPRWPFVIGGVALLAGVTYILVRRRRA